MITHVDRWTLASRPHGAPVPENFRRETVPLTSLEEGCVRVAVKYVSVDPTMRGWMSQVPSYLPPIAIDAVIRAFGVGEVIESLNPRFAVANLFPVCSESKVFTPVMGADWGSSIPPWGRSLGTSVHSE